MLESKCWELEMKLQKKDVWKIIEKRIEKIKLCIHISQQKEVNESFVGR